MEQATAATAATAADERGPSWLAEKQVPKSITLASETITKDNVDQYLSLGFES